MSVLTRRNFLRGLLAAPAIVAVGNIMPVKALPPALEAFTLDKLMECRALLDESRNTLYLPPSMAAALRKEAAAFVGYVNPIFSGALGEYCGVRIVETEIIAG